MDERRRLMMQKKDTGDGRGFIGDYEYVDLGLPSGKLWSTCNVGDSDENPYSGNPHRYKYGWGSKNVTAYNQNDPVYTGYESPLDASADTATQVMGSDWHMPTEEEFNEMLENTNGSWILIEDGRFGCVKRESKSNPNKYILFPVVGGPTYPSSLGGKMGYYLSSTPVPNENGIRGYYVREETLQQSSISGYSMLRSYCCGIKGVHAAL